MTPRLTANFAVDPSSHTVLICCRDCGWRDLAPDRRRAWQAAGDHARAVHPSELTATQANIRRLTYRKRHA